ncbi:hypothetical protein B0H11DRAFT_2232045 [Mycena galericulata]|nr:hypothetical protein B0H11DRAFT_2232045 [Mycena galericulata]
MLPRSYEPLKPDAPKDKVDNHQFSSFRRGDLALLYVYEVATEYELGGELVTLPIIYHVYRRDFHLRWSEIAAYFRDGTIPSRYGPSHTVDGVFHSPMNEENFRKMERHDDFESTLYHAVLPRIGRSNLLTMTPEEVAREVSEQYHTWHLDAVPRARAALLHLRYNCNASKDDIEVVAAHNRDKVATLMEKSAFVFADPEDRTAKGTMYKNASIEATIQAALFSGLLADGMQYPELFDDTCPHELEADDETQPPHKPTFSLVSLANATTAVRASIMEYSSGHFVREDYSRKVFKPYFEAELRTLRAWHTYTSNPTTIEGDGPVRMQPPSFLTRTLQETIFANGRYSVLKDVVAPVPSAALMDDSDFAQNQ